MQSIDSIETYAYRTSKDLVSEKEMINIINQQLEIDKIYLYAKDPCERKYQFLINKREATGLTFKRPRGGLSKYISSGEKVKLRFL